MNESVVEKLQEITLADRPHLQPVLDSANVMACDYNFVDLFCWGKIYSLAWARCDDMLVIYDARDDFIFMPVGGNPDARTVRDLSDSFRRRGKSGNMAFAGEEFWKRYRRQLRCFKVVNDRANADYIYLAKNLHELRGNKLHRKKNLVSQFERNNPDYRSIMLGTKHVDECYTLSEKWCRERTGDIIGFTHETSALRRALEHFDELGLGGVGIIADDRLVAFSLFSRQNSTTATVHFEKYDPEVKGSAQIINRETAGVLRKNYRFINREQDMGIAGLRKAKRSYRPEFLLRSFQLLRID